ncbi:MAG: type II toxin-antitoxin system HipA family toxin [Opitutaceae bacterium]|nr:type II toxin-antitoxin system HipA family toxin [Opitutaceae bacterium]
MPRRLHRVTVATVQLWGREVGAVAWNDDQQVASFEYTDAFIRSGLDIAPLMMPPRRGIFSFPALNRETFRGLPGLLADSLPDRFGNRLIDLWLQQQGRAVSNFTPVERLCYIGSRGMGALEFKPALTREPRQSAPLEVAELAALARDILAERSHLAVNLQSHEGQALGTIIRVGTSAGGARAKAVIAWNPRTQEVRSGQVAAPEGFESWILKFDGVQDKELGDPQGFGRIEYAYHHMAVAAGIEMAECRLLEEGGRAHFMTRRFDRAGQGGKIHMQSLCALGHYDFNLPGAHGYEQALTTIQQLGLGYDALRTMFRRMAFNLIARNQDDHTRNIAFLMDPTGRWRLAPAFDLIWAYNSEGVWTSRHQLRVNGKQDGFVREDLLVVARQFGIKDGPAIVDEVGAAVSRWPEYAKTAGVSAPLIRRIGETHRRDLAE